MAHLGLVGIGVMGGAFALNLAERGHDVSLLDRDPARAREVADEGASLTGRLIPSGDAESFVASLPTPRAVLVLVPSGKPLDAVIDTLTPLLSPGDLIADMGNSHYKDTEARVVKCEAAGLMFQGMGVSGGAEGARHGPAIMAGGSQAAWDRVRGPLQDASAKFEGDPCCDWYGPGGAGHFIKMIHNGIEYAIMQMIAEVYGLLRDGQAMPPAQIGAVFGGWRTGPLQSYLIDIAAEVSDATDPETGLPMLDVILDSAGQKGTGRWSVIEALHLGQPVNTMQAAVEVRNVSALGSWRADMVERWGAQRTGRLDVTPDQLERALLLGKVVAYDQGFGVLRAASEAFDWSLDLGAIARGWRAGCIIRSGLLDRMAAAFDTGASDLLASEDFAALLADHDADLRGVVSAGVAAGMDAPALAAALSHVTAGRTPRGTTNMIQALRDRFGAHGFRRVGGDGSKHNGPWHD